MSNVATTAEIVRMMRDAIERVERNIDDEDLCFNIRSAIAAGMARLSSQASRVKELEAGLGDALPVLLYEQTRLKNSRYKPDWFEGIASGKTVARVRALLEPEEG